MKLLRAKQVAEKLSVAEKFVWKLAKRPDFPRPYRIAVKHTAWSDEELDAWLFTYKQGDRNEHQDQ